MARAIGYADTPCVRPMPCGHTAARDVRAARPCFFARAIGYADTPRVRLPKEYPQGVCGNAA